MLVLLCVFAVPSSPPLPAISQQFFCKHWHASSLLVSRALSTRSFLQLLQSIAMLEPIRCRLDQHSSIMLKVHCSQQIEVWEMLGVAGLK